MTPWQITLGILWLTSVVAGFGLVTAGTVVGVRALVDPPISYALFLAVFPVVIYCYGRWVWGATPWHKMKWRAPRAE